VFLLILSRVDLTVKNSNRNGIESGSKIIDCGLNGDRWFSAKEFRMSSRHFRWDSLRVTNTSRYAHSHYFVRLSSHRAFLEQQLEAVMRGLPRNWCNWQSAQLVRRLLSKGKTNRHNPRGLVSPLTLKRHSGPPLSSDKNRWSRDGEFIKIRPINAPSRHCR